MNAGTHASQTLLIHIIESNGNYYLINPGNRLNEGDIFQFVADKNFLMQQYAQHEDFINRFVQESRSIKAVNFIFNGLAFYIVLKPPNQLVVRCTINCTCCISAFSRRF